jgi:hypothetical protein
VGRRPELGLFVGRAPRPLGDIKVVQWEPARGGGERPGRDSENRWESRAKKWGGGKRPAASGDRPLLKYAEGPLPGSATRWGQALQKFGGVDGCAPRGARGLSGRHFPSGPAFVSRFSSSCSVRPPPAVAAAEAHSRAEPGSRGARGLPQRGVQTGLWETGCAPENRSGSSRHCCC